MTDSENLLAKLGIPMAIVIGAGIIGASIYMAPRDSGSVKSAQTAPPTTGTQGTGAGAPVIVKNISTEGLPSLGKASAPVTVVEFADFQCPYCGKLFQDSLPSLKKDYIDTGKVKFYYNDFAFLGAESIQAASAAKCADDQGKFWEYHDYLYSHQDGENRGAFSDDNLKKFAGAVGLDQKKFDSCLDTDKYEQEVKDETARAKTYGVGSTPSTFVNGELVKGAVPYATLKAKIEEKLKKP